MTNCFGRTQVRLIGQTIFYQTHGQTSDYKSLFSLELKD